MPKSNPNLAYRVVGYTEYANALQHLDKLASIASEEEFEAIDQIVTSEPEFKIYTNLARKMQPPDTTLIESPDSEDDDYSRHGFRWVTALARVELAAIIAGFKQHRAPFHFVAGTGYDIDEYRELIQDGARTHYWGLKSDPIFAKLRRRFQANPLTLTYLRRMNIATAFLRASGDVSAGKDYSAQQLGEVQHYLKTLQGIRERLKVSITLYLADVTSRSRTDRSRSSEKKLLQMCNEGICREFD